MVKSKSTEDDVILANDLRLREIEKEVVLSREQRKIMSQQIKEIKNDVKEIRLVVDGLSEKLENRFASKWVEWLAKWIVGLVLTGVWGAIITFFVSTPWK